jgi:hypothetical protein
MFNGGLLYFFWYMFIIYLFVMVIWMFIRVFADIFHRENLSGWGKFGWILVIFIIPFIGILIYMIVRPKNTEQDQRDMAEMQVAQARLVGGSAVDDIAKARPSAAGGQAPPPSCLHRRRTPAPHNPFRRSGHLQTGASIKVLDFRTPDEV